MINPNKSDVGRRVRYVGADEKTQELLSHGGKLTDHRDNGLDAVLVSWDDIDPEPLTFRRADLDWELGGDHTQAHLSEAPPSQPVPVAPFDLWNTATTIAVYALNMAHGAILELFELDHVVAIGTLLGVETTQRLREKLVTRRILDELFAERTKQIELGYTAEYDDANPIHARFETLARLNNPNYARRDLVEAAAIIVAEIERVDRAAAREKPEENK